MNAAYRKQREKELAESWAAALEVFTIRTPIFASICWQSSIVIPGSVSTRSKGMSSAAKAA